MYGQDNCHILSKSVAYKIITFKLLVPYNSLLLSDVDWSNGQISCHNTSASWLTYV